MQLPIANCKCNCKCECKCGKRSRNYCKYCIELFNWHSVGHCAYATWRRTGVSSCCCNLLAFRSHILFDQLRVWQPQQWPVSSGHVCGKPHYQQYVMRVGTCVGEFVLSWPLAKHKWPTLIVSYLLQWSLLFSYTAQTYYYIDLFFMLRVFFIKSTLHIYLYLLYNFLRVLYSVAQVRNIYSETSTVTNILIN